MKRVLIFLLFFVSAVGLISAAPDKKPFIYNLEVENYEKLDFSPRIEFHHMSIGNSMYVWSSGFYINAGILDLKVEFLTSTTD